MRAAAGVWRWRRNPLCRTTDLVEAWAAFATVLLIVFLAPAVGRLCGTLTHAALQESVRVQHEQRHRTTALVVRAAPGPAMPADPEIPSERAPHTRVVANWTARDGSRHTGTVPTTRRAAQPGDRFPVWTDERGRVVGRPMDDVTASTHATVAGIGATAAAAVFFEGGRRLFVWRLTLRRYTRLDRAWAGAGPDWGRTGTGS
ncbi:Rv1733c family protein [Streptomyces enissocaesilis]|uniref:Integral membrane protein n=1 Tax=Streptomyces enissocaesilis TaxID=332589 RepID=A0ABN3X488_9ACTN